MTQHFEFDAELFEWEGNGAWHFVAVPADVADEIEGAATVKRGFGSVPVRATVGHTTWETSVFPDKGRGTYLLPVKKAVRVAEDWHDGATTTVVLQIREQLT